VDVRDSREDVDDRWFAGLLQDLVGLEYLEFSGQCPAVVRRLCQEVVEEELHVPIETLAVQAIEEYLARGAQT